MVFCPCKQLYAHVNNNNKKYNNNNNSSNNNNNSNSFIDNEANYKILFTIYFT